MKRIDVKSVMYGLLLIALCINIVSWGLFHNQRLTALERNVIMVQDTVYVQAEPIYRNEPALNQRVADIETWISMFVAANDPGQVTDWNAMLDRMRIYDFKIDSLEKEHRKKMTDWYAIPEGRDGSY